MKITKKQLKQIIREEMERPDSELEDLVHAARQLQQQIQIMAYSSGPVEIEELAQTLDQAGVAAGIIMAITEMFGGGNEEY